MSSALDGKNIKDPISRDFLLQVFSPTASPVSVRGPLMTIDFFAHFSSVIYVKIHQARWLAGFAHKKKRFAKKRN